MGPFFKVVVEVHDFRDDQIQFACCYFEFVAT